MGRTIQKEIASLLRPNQRLTAVHYFTALVRGPSQQRQSLYLQALEAHCDLTLVHVGRFLAKRVDCRNCGHSHVSYEEKESDVSLAVKMVEDAALDAFDQAMIVSGDSDMTPAIRSVRRIAPAKRLIAVFPPRRSSVTLRQGVDATIQIFDKVPERYALPETVEALDGTKLRRPAHWR